MKKSVWAGVLAGLIAIGAAAQTAGDQQALRDALMNKQLLLRGFSAQTEMQWNWDGLSLVQSMPLVRTLGVMTATSVKINDAKIEIKGDRRTLLRKTDSTYELSQSKDHVRIKVDLTGGDLSALLPKIPDMLFYPNIQSMLADIPGQYRNMLPTRQEGAVYKGVSDSCDCADSRTECRQEGLQMGHGITPPMTTSRPVMPMLSDEAQRANFNDHIQVHLNIDENGHPKDLWITKPAGMGMDEITGEAISRTPYKPATCHGKPVEAPILIDIAIRAG